ncbi:MAG: NAD-dependent epimerase/dehydratase family protein [Xanthomonadales bacterium]|nr:NAD-dependent epimerase/dehydratase family protein [Xanthomonadales bacterium]
MPLRTDPSPPSHTPLLRRRYLVLGGRGFIGRHCVAALQRAGAEVIVAGRRATASLPQALPVQGLLTHESWNQVLELPALGHLDGVLNAVGILRQSPWRRYVDVHERAPTALAEACARRAMPLLHISALGLDAPACSGFIRSKLAGDAGVRAAGEPCLVVRPSLLDGPDGFGSRWLRAVARLPLQATPSSASGRISALHVDDLADAIVALFACNTEQRRTLAPHRVIELGGERAMTLAQYLQHLRGTRPPAWQVPVPHALARGVAHLCDLLHLTPFSFGHLELLARDNLARGQQLQALLGRPQRPLGRDLPAAPLRPLAGSAAS